MVAPHPDLLNKIRNTGRLVRQNRQHLIPDFMKQFPDQYMPLENFNVFESFKPWVESAKPRKKRSLIPTMAPPVQDRIIVLCVDFNDKVAAIPTTDIYNRFFASAGNSLRNYYIENSYGKYVPAGEVHGWYRAPQPMSYYVNGDNGFGAYPNNAQKLVQDVIDLAAADPDVNWGVFDNAQDGTIDYLVVVHAGAEAAYTGSTGDFWAHVWSFDPVVKDGYTFEYFALVSEYMGLPWIDPQRSGTDCHEFGHLLGLPDLYDTSGNSNGIGNFSLMSHGSWADSGFTPTHLDAWCKDFLGFSITLLDQTGVKIVNDAETNDVNYRFSTPTFNEYFYIENRQQKGFDSFLPANGLLVWKVNELRSGNDNELCYKVGLVQADNMFHLENSVNLGDDADSYPGRLDNRSIGLSTSPNTRLCNGSFPTLLINNISDSSDIMSFSAQSDVCSQIVINIGIV